MAIHNQNINIPDQYLEIEIRKIIDQYDGPIKKNSLLSIKEIKTVLTRLGQGCKCFVLADPMQTDLKSQSLSGGFETLVETFSDEDSLQMGVHTFSFTEDDIMRSELVKFLILLSFGFFAIWLKSSL